MMRRRGWSVLGALLSFASQACEVPKVPTEATVATSLQNASLPMESLDDEFVRLARSLPGGFGGLYISPTGEAVVWLQDLARAPEVAGALEARVSQLPARNSSRPRLAFRKGRFRFDSLKRWHSAIDARWTSIPGIVSTDVAEELNQVQVEARDSAAASAALASILRVEGVPPEAVSVIPGVPMTQAQDLSEYFGTIPGGVALGAAGLGICTAMMAVKYNGLPAVITNSHCGPTFGSVDNVLYHQAGGIVGQEIADRGSWIPPFLARFSDASIIHVTGSAPTELGYLARTLAFDTYPPDGGTGSTTIDPVNPRFPLNSPGYRATSPVLGEYVNKIGRVTGWIEGPINKTCYTVESGHSGWKLWCSYRFNGEIQVGDSGAPVFYREFCPGQGFPAARNCALVAGIIMGTTAGQAYFSAMQGIFDDYSSATIQLVP